MSQISGYNIPLHQEVISDFIFHIRKHLQSRGLQYEFKVAPEVILRNEDFKEGYIIPDVSVKKKRKFMESTRNDNRGNQKQKLEYRYQESKKSH